jgi:hypothetical protein
MREYPLQDDGRSLMITATRSFAAMGAALLLSSQTLPAITLSSLDDLRPVPRHRGYSGPLSRGENCHENPMKSPMKNSVHVRTNHGCGFSGALAHCKPLHEGEPIKWGHQIWGDFAKGFAFAFLAAGIGGFTSSLLRPRRMVRGMAVGASAGIALVVVGYGGGSLIAGVSEIEFDTTISKVFSTSAPQFGKRHRIKPEPYFKQVISIPESPNLLITCTPVVPFRTGEAIVAKVYLNRKNQVLCWSARPADRAEND